MDESWRLDVVRRGTQEPSGENGPRTTPKLESDSLGKAPGYVYRGYAKAKVGEGRAVSWSALGGADVASDRKSANAELRGVLQVQALVELLEEKGLLARVTPNAARPLNRTLDAEIQA